jgi:hypothetical protein
MGMGMRELLRHTNVRLLKAYRLLALPVTAPWFRGQLLLSYALTRSDAKRR